MRTPQCLLVILTLALLLGFSAPVLAEDKAQQLTETSKGRVVKLWTDQNRFTMKDATGTEWTFQVGRDAKVRLNDRDSKLADLKEGDEVTITYRMMAQHINAGPVAQAGDITRGHILGITADQNQFTFKDSKGKEWTIHLGRDTKVLLNDKESRLADLKQGDEVCILYEKQGDMLMARDIHTNRGATQAAEVTRGNIQSVAAEQQQLVLKDRNGKERKFQVSQAATVRVNNQDRKLADLKEGEHAAVTYLFVVSDVRSSRENP